MSPQGRCLLWLASCRAQGIPSTGALISGNIVFGIEPPACRKCGTYSPTSTALLAVIPASATRKLDHLRLPQKLGRRTAPLRARLFGASISDRRRSYGNRRTCSWHGHRLLHCALPVRQANGFLQARRPRRRQFVAGGERGWSVRPTGAGVATGARRAVTNCKPSPTCSAGRGRRPSRLGEGPASLARKARPEAAGLQIRRQLSRILPGLMATPRMGHGLLAPRIDHIATPGLAWRDRQRFIFNPQLIEPLRSRNLNTGTRISR